MAEAFAGLRNDYAAAKSNRFRRTRTVPSLGSGADYHYRSESEFLRILEYARDMDRNDSIVGQTIDRAVTNTIQSGFALDPQTGDEKLDKDLLARWQAWAEDAEACDLAGEHTFADMERLILRSMFVDGDILALQTKTGALELIEAHRLRTPRGTKRNVVHGVLLNDQRRRLEYWLTKRDIDPNSAVHKVSDIRAYPARDGEGRRQVFHIYNPKRVSQTRGISAMAPIFDLLGMFEDIQFAKLVQQQVVSCFAVFRQRELLYEGSGAVKRGAESTETLSDGSSRTLQGIAPGMDVLGEPGEELKGFSPNVPNPEFFEHVRLILTLVGVNLGLPLVMVLMDASETNFSGWRGAVDQARLGFRGNQDGLVRQFHRGTYHWQLRLWMEAEAALRRAAARRRIEIARHRWNPPRWPYIQPLQDAQADKLRIAAGLTSMRRVQAERGRDEDEVAREIVADNANRIRLAIEAAERINLEHQDAAVDWRELASFDPKGRKPAAPKKVMEDLARGVRAGVPIAVSEARAAGLGLTPEPPEGETLLRFNDQDILAYHIENGLLTINEVRSRLNLPPVDWGDVPVRRAGVAPVEVAGSREKDTETSETVEDVNDATE
jgi:lambda family phage portal protein